MRVNAQQHMTQSAMSLFQHTAAVAAAVAVVAVAAVVVDKRLMDID